MPLTRLQELLDSEGVKYVAIRHSPAYTAQEIAASAHVAGEELAKTVVVKLDGKMAMVVMPAPKRVDLEVMRKEAGADTIELAEEEEFERLFPGCELGAMPPFGNLFNMPVFVDRSLGEHDEIAFNAGSHIELIRMPYTEFARLVRPQRADLAAAVTAGVG